MGFPSYLICASLCGGMSVFGVLVPHVGIFQIPPPFTERCKVLSESFHTQIGISPRDLSAVLVQDASRFHLLTKLGVFFKFVMQLVLVWSRN